MKIASLKSMVNNGWNIANRRALTRLIGEGEMKRLTEGYNFLRATSENNFFKGLAGTGNRVWLPADKLELSQVAGEMRLKFPMRLEEFFYQPKVNHVIKNKQINLKDIRQYIGCFEIEVADYFRKATRLPKSSLKSKTIEKLYSKEFKANRCVNEDGYRVTTVIDKVTGKPVEAYVRKNPDTVLCDTITRESYDFLVKAPNGEYEQIGKRSFELDRVLNRITSDWMDSAGSEQRFAGVGLRGHQLAVERMLQENFDTVEIIAEAQAFPFHYKSGFRVNPSKKVVSKERIDLLLSQWNLNTKISKRELKKCLVLSKNGDGHYTLSSQSWENLRKLLYLKNNGKYMAGDTPMSLQGKSLTDWIKRAQSQPILL